MALDLDAYRRRAQEFITELDREYHQHLAGLKRELEIEPIYDRHAGLFDLGVVADLRQLAAAPGAGAADEARHVRCLLAFALDGLLGRETRAETEEAARLEATLVVETTWGSPPYRQVPVEQANEPDAGRRRELEAARDEVLEERLNPLYASSLERAHALCVELGWASYAEAYSDARGIEFDLLARQTRSFLEATEPVYAGLVDPCLERAELPPLGRLERADLPRFFRSTRFDPLFPADRLLPSLERTLAGLGIDLHAQENIHLDTEPRETKSPRAFCSPILVPDEVHLVIAPIGGSEDYAALLHEAGHAEHYANTDPRLAFEFRHLGDNSVTESFAFLFDQLTEEPEWLRTVLGVGEVEELVAQARASRLVFFRRYAAKLAYELELHGPEPDLAAMPRRYADLLGSATRIAWPRAAWAADVDSGFYVACYLRAWALETHWRVALRERFGERWFEARGAGEWLLGLWRHGQRLNADELLAAELDTELDFSAVGEEVAGWVADPVGIG